MNKNKKKFEISPKLIFIILTVVCIGLIIVSVFFSDKIAPFKQAVGDVMTPMQKGIDKFTADDALSPYSEMYSENIMHLLKTKHSRWLTDESDRKNIEKVKNALVRYGYDFTEINLAVKDYFEEDN